MPLFSLSAPLAEVQDDLKASAFWPRAGELGSRKGLLALAIAVSALIAHATPVGVKRIDVQTVHAAGNDPGAARRLKSRP